MDLVKGFFVHVCDLDALALVHNSIGERFVTDAEFISQADILRFKHRIVYALVCADLRRVEVSSRGDRVVSACVHLGVLELTGVDGASAFDWLREGQPEFLRLLEVDLLFFLIFIEIHIFSTDGLASMVTLCMTGLTFCGVEGSHIFVVLKMVSALSVISESSCAKKWGIRNEARGLSILVRRVCASQLLLQHI